LVLELVLDLLRLLLVLLLLCGAKLVRLDVLLLDEISCAVDFSQLILNLLALTSQVLAHSSVVIVASGVRIAKVQVAVISKSIAIISTIVVAEASLLLLVLLEDGERIGQLEGWLLHLQVEDALVVVVIIRMIDGIDSFDTVLIIWI